MYLPLSVRAEVTGSVAINTAPKQKPPRTRCSYQGMLAIALPSMPMALNTQAMNAPPTNTEIIVFQLAMPVHRRITAPIRIAITLVSPMEPGIRPVTISMLNAGAAPVVAASPSGVATVSPSTDCPRPKMLSPDTQTASPDILVGYAKNRNARVINATLKMFIPVPPNTSLAKITENAVATARIHNGQSTGTIIGIRIPETRNPS